jgi:hypothetical protein
MMQATYFVWGAPEAALFFCLTIFSKLFPTPPKALLSPAQLRFRVVTHPVQQLQIVVTAAATLGLR